MEKNKKRKVPWFWRRRFSCPDCGQIITLEEMNYNCSFDCKRCGQHFSKEDFLNENSDKWSIKADLNNE